MALIVDSTVTGAPYRWLGALRRAVPALSVIRRRLMSACHASSASFAKQSISPGGFNYPMHD